VRRRDPGRLALLAGFLAVAVPAPTDAQGRECGVLRAVTNADGRKFADIRFNLDTKSGFSVRVGRGKSDLADPESCDLNYDQTDITLSCQWRFPDYAAALAFFDPLVEKMRRCLSVPLPSAEIAPQSPGWLIMRKHEADLTAGKGDTRVEISLVEYTRTTDEPLPADLAYFVDLSSEWGLD
jgi:hypothetical protein